MKEVFNRFEWNKTECKGIEKLREQFPSQNLIGKRIKSINLIGQEQSKYNLMDNFWRRKEEHVQTCYGEPISFFIANEPIVFVFDDNATFEFQWKWEKLISFSENQIDSNVRDGINYCDYEPNTEFQDILLSTVIDVIIDNKITIKMNNGFEIIICYDYDSCFKIGLFGNKSYSLKERNCQKEFLEIAYQQIPIIEGHNSSSYFWIEAGNELDSIEQGYYGIDYARDTEISIEEDYIIDYLSYFLLKYFDPTIYKSSRNLEDGTPEFEWNLEPNLYKYETINKMIIEIKESCKLLKSDYDNPKIIELKKKLYNAVCGYNRYVVKQTGKDEDILLKEKLDSIIDFYNRFCFQLEQIMKYYPDYECIDFMGP